MVAKIYLIRKGVMLYRYHPKGDRGLWQSVNDFRVQLGRKILEGFLDFISAVTSNLAFINTTYLTRA